MNFYYTFLLLLVVLSAYSENPEHGKPPDSFDLTIAAVCPNSSSDLLGVLAPVLPQNESGSVLSQNMVLPQDEVYRTDLPLNEVGSVLQNGVFMFVLPQNRVFEIVLSQFETNKTVLHQSNIVTVNCQWLFEFYVEYWGQNYKNFDLGCDTWWRKISLDS